jgi:hypothetical protein
MEINKIDTRDQIDILLNLLLYYNNKLVIYFLNYLYIIFFK